MKDYLKYFTILVVVAAICGVGWGLKYVIGKVYFANHVQVDLKAQDDAFNNKLDQVTNDVTQQVVQEQDLKNGTTDEHTKEALAKLDKALEDAKDLPKGPLVAAVPAKRKPKVAAPEPPTPPVVNSGPSVSTVQSADGMWDYYCREFPEQSDCR